jgi:hypothetical protein
VRTAWLASLVCLTTTACALDSDRPPLRDICADGACDRGEAGEPGSGGETTTGAGGGAGEAGAGEAGAGGIGGKGGAGGTGGGATQGVPFAGSFGSFDTPEFALASNYMGMGRVIAQGPAGGYVEAEYDGSRYAFEAVRQGLGTWVQLIPDNPEFMAMLVSVDTSREHTALRLPVLRLSALEEIYRYASVETLVEDGAAHVIVGFVSSISGTAVGIEVTSPATNHVFYSTNIGWDDGVSATSLDGWAVLPNLTAQDFGDSEILVEASAPADETFRMPVAQDTATFLRYLVGK